MICLSKADEGTFRHLEYNQSPRSLSAEHTTRQDLNGIANLREHVGAGEDGDSGGCNGGCGDGGTAMDEKRWHGGIPPGPMASASDAAVLTVPCLSVGKDDRLSALRAFSPFSLSDEAWGWVRWLASVLAGVFVVNYLTGPAPVVTPIDATITTASATIIDNAQSSIDVQLSRRHVKRDSSTCESALANSDEYNTALHAGALLIIWFVSTLACGFPMLARRFPGLRIPNRFFFVVRHFGTGVLIATAFVHLLPTAFISLGDPCAGKFWTEDYPAMPGAIALAAIFFVCIVEMVFHPARRCSSMPKLDTPAEEAGEKKQPCGEGCPATTSEVQETSLTVPMRDMQPPRRRSGSMGHTLNRLNTIEASDDETTVNQQRKTSAHEEAVDDDDEQEQDLEHAPTAVSGNISPEQKLRKERLQCVLLELGILFHSIFIGMALAVSVGSEFVILLIAIVFHQTFEGLALGARIATIKWPKNARRQPWLMAFAYGCTTPIGQAIGIATHTLYAPGSREGLIVVGVMNSISAGLLTFASLVELLSEDFLSDESWEYLRGRKRIVACLLVFAGAFCMALVGAWA